jgi:hypothetical protein
MSTVNREALQQSGVEIVDVPHLKSKAKDACDKTILMDMTFWVSEHKPPACVILISGDRDFSMAVNRFSQRLFKVILITPPKRNVCEILTGAAYKVISFDKIVGYVLDVEVSQTVVEEKPIENEAECVRLLVEQLHNSSGMPRRLPAQALRLKSKVDIKKLVQKNLQIFKVETVVSLTPEYERFLKAQFPSAPVSVQALSPPAPISLFGTIASGVSDDAVKEHISTVIKVAPVNSLTELQEKIRDNQNANVATRTLRSVLTKNFKSLQVDKNGVISPVMSSPATSTPTSPTAKSPPQPTPTTPDNIVLEILFGLVSAKPAGVELTVLGNELRNKFPDIKLAGKLKAFLERNHEFFEIVTTGPLLFRVFVKQGETVLAVPETPVELDQTVCDGESDEETEYTSASEEDYEYDEYTSTENIGVIEEESHGFRLLPPPPQGFASRLLEK